MLAEISANRSIIYIKMSYTVMFIRFLSYLHGYLARSVSDRVVQKDINIVGILLQLSDHEKRQMMTLD